MSVQNRLQINMKKTLHLDESVEVLEIERSSSRQDRVVTVLYEARAGPKTYWFKITAKGITLV